MAPRLEGFQQEPWQDQMSKEYRDGDEHWNRCDVCGRFIAIADFDNGASRVMTTPDTAFSAESYRTLCRKHAVRTGFTKAVIDDVRILG